MDGTHSSFARRSFGSSAESSISSSHSISKTAELLDELFRGDIAKRVATAAGMVTPGLGIVSAVPGFYPLRRLCLHFLRRDPTEGLLKLAVIFSLFGAATAVWQNAQSMSGWFTSSVTIEANDTLHRCVLSWLEKHVVAKRANNFTASCGTKKTSNPADGFDMSYYSRRLLDRGQPAEAEKRVIHYAPAAGGGQRFWFGKLPFAYKVQTETQHHRDYIRKPNTITLTCLGWSTKPLKRFLAECQRFDELANRGMTEIFTAGDDVDNGRGLLWKTHAPQPSRPLCTVDFDETEKKVIVEELDDYLSPGKPFWYSERGLPYRKGYLLFGPPGTGKTSFSKAIAGHYGLPLYLINIGAKNMNDGLLARQFEALPGRCVVLLEDIDSAGIGRQVMQENQQQSGPSKKQSERSSSRSRYSQYLEQYAMGNGSSNGVTLAGLLNAIDGAISAQGRILIMTTNTPDTLDGALIRDGRVDRQIYLGYVDKAVARRIFLRMLSKSDEERKREKELLDPSNIDEGKNTTSKDDLDLGKLEEAADKFAAHVPLNMITPAALQGFLLRQRTADNALKHIEQRCADKVEEARARAQKALDDQKAREEQAARAEQGYRQRLAAAVAQATRQAQAVNGEFVHVGHAIQSNGNSNTSSLQGSPGPVSSDLSQFSNHSDLSPNAAECQPGAGHQVEDLTQEMNLVEAVVAAPDMTDREMEEAIRFRITAK